MKILLLSIFLGPSALAHAQEFVVHGHHLLLHCQGNYPNPIVILIAGGDGKAAVWNKVQPQISKFATVCGYDRAPQPQTASEIVDDLEALLQTARLRPPYVLVGHSIGGLYARLFDLRHDQQVAGMVLLDSSHEEQIWRFAQGEPAALSEYPHWRDRNAMRAAGFLPPGEHLRWHFSKPLVVIEHGIPPEPVWHAMQVDLASRSPKARLVTATRSSHYIQKLQPELVIEEIRSVVEACRRN